MPKENGKTRDLLSQIEDRLNKHVDGDLEFTEGQKRVEEFKFKETKNQERINKIEGDIREKEEEIGNQVLAGGSSTVTSLSQLRQKLREAEDEGRIFKSVIEKSEKSLLSLKAKISLKISIINVRLLRDAVNDLSRELEPAVKKILTLQTACKMPHLSFYDWSVSPQSVSREALDLQKMISEVQDRRELMEQMVEEVEQL